MASILKMKVDRSEAGSITLPHPTAVEKLLVTAGMQNIRSVSTPLVPNVELVDEGELTEEERSIMAAAPQSRYRSLVGSLMYLATMTKPDISFAVISLSRLMAAH